MKRRAKIAEKKRMSQTKRHRGRKSDGTDLHSVQIRVKHSAHTAPLNVAGLEYVCVCV